MGYFDLVVTRKGEATVRYPMLPEGIIVGRSEHCDVTLPSKQVSRMHARFWVEEGLVQVEDLDSRNGVEVNGARIVQVALSDEDQIVIGDYRLRVQSGTESGFNRAVISKEQAQALEESITRVAGDERLLVLYNAAHLLGELFDIDELLEKILELIFSALPADRGFILTVNESGKEPEIRAFRGQNEGGDGPPLSQTLIRSVVAKGESILTEDAQADSRFGHAESVMNHEIHAAMCAPLHGRHRVVGVIYVDTGNTSSALSENDLELLTAIARVVGIAVENARLYQENMERERLATLGLATASLGHCIKNILTAIRGGAQFINYALERDDLSYLHRGWPILRRAMERIDMLVMNMLVFSKDRKPDWAPVDVNSMIHDVLGLFQERAEKWSVGLFFEPSSEVTIEADGAALYRVILNLVVNAVEACEHNGGAVTVTTGLGEGGCTIAISDTGIGIPSEILPQLSQVFVSSKGSTGTGLGLASAYKIVREHGGEINVESCVDEGTSFQVFIPAPVEKSGSVRKTLIQRAGGVKSDA